MSGRPLSHTTRIPTAEMITEKDLDKYFKPEHPWVRNLYCENRASEKLDDSSSRRLATLTSWKPRDDKGHRYHNALVMLNIMPEDVMYHHMYDFVKGWGEKLDTLERTHKKIDVQAECLAYFNPWQLNDSNTRGLTVDDVLSIAILVCHVSPRAASNVDIFLDRAYEAGASRLCPRDDREGQGSARGGSLLDFPRIVQGLEQTR